MLDHLFGLTNYLLSLSILRLEPHLPRPALVGFYEMESKVNHGDGSATLRAKATTQNVLGLDTPQPKVNPKWARHCENLTRLRDEVLAKKETLTQNANVSGESGVLGEHLADAATDSYDRDWALSMLSSEQSALYEIEAALDRINRGTYGICELTGRPIES